MTDEPTQVPVDSDVSQQLGDIVRVSPFLRGKRLRVECQAGRVTLHGTVRSYFHKQMAQETLRRVKGIERIENRLQVVYPSA